MTEVLDLGSILARVGIEDVEFQRTYVRVVRQFANLGSEATRASAGTDTLDRGFVSVAASANSASAGMERAGKTANALGSSETKAAAAADRQAKAESAVAAALDRSAAAGSKAQQATLREIAAQDRLAAVQESGTATTRQLASAQASLIGAQRGVAASNEAMAASSGRAGGAMGGLLKTAGELGLVIGAIELVKKAFDITKEANEFQRAMVQTQTNADVTASEVHRASGALLDMAGTVAAAPSDLATAWYHAKSVGLDYAHSIDATRIAAEGARVGHADLEQTMNALTATVASNIPGVKNMSSAMGQLIAVVGSGDMKLTDLNQALGSGILTVVKGYGLSLTDVGAALATFGDNNIRGAEAATMLRMAVQSMAVPAKAGAAELDKLGLKSDTLAKDMQTGGLNKAVLDLKSHLDKAGVSSVEVGAVLTEVFGKRAGPGVAVLVSQVDRLESKFKILRDSGASFDAKWKATTQTASFALASVGHEAEAAGIRLTEKLGPSIASAARLLGVLLPEAISAAGSALHPFAVAWDVVGPVVKAAAEALGFVLEHLGPILPVLGAVGGAALAMYAAFKGYQIIRLAVNTMVDGFTMIRARAAGALTDIQRYGVGSGAAMRGAATEANVAAAQMQAAMLASAQADIEAQAVRERAAAGAAVAYAEMTAASKAASDEMIVAADAAAAAAVAQSRATALAAAEVAAASEAAAAEVVIAGDTARVGWAGLAGPLGLAAIGVLSLVTMFHHSTTASKEATDAAKAYTEALSSGGKIDVTDTIVKQLKDNHLPETISELNAQLKTFGSTATFASKDFATAIASGGKPLDDLRAKLKAVIAAGTVKGNVRGPLEGLYDRNGVNAAKKALSEVTTQHKALSKSLTEDIAGYKALGTVVAPITNVADALHLTSDQVKAYAGVLGLGITKSGGLVDATNANKQAIKDVGDQYATGASNVLDMLNAMSTFNSSQKTSADRAALIGSILKANAGDALSYGAAINGAATATSQMGTDIASAAKSVGKSGETTTAYLRSIVNLKTGTINYSRTAAAPLISNLQSIQTAAINAASATYQHELATKGAGAASDDAVKQYRGVETSLEGQFTKLGLTTGQAKKLTEQYLGVPANVKTQIEAAGADPVVTVLNKIGQLLATLTGQQWNTDINLHGHLDNAAKTILALGKDPSRVTSKLDSPTFAQAVGTQAAFGRSTIPPNTRFTVGEAGWEGGVTDSQGRASIFSNAQSKAMGFRAPVGYASGTGSMKDALASLLASEGATRSGIAGWFGNTSAESGFRLNPSPGPAHGLQQWQDGRYTALLALARKMHESWTSQDVQFAMIDKELHQKRFAPTLAALRSGKSAASIASVVNSNYEGSADHSGNRERLASGYYNSSAVKNARGATVGKITTGTTDGKKVWIYNGQQYASERAAENARARDAAKTPNVSPELSILSQLAKLGPAKNAGSFASNLSGLEQKLTKAGFGTFVKGLAGENKALLAAAKGRDAAAAALATAQQAVKAAVDVRSQDYGSFKTAGVGSFDITSAGADADGRVSAGSLGAAQTQDVTRVRTWAADMQKLIGSHVFPGSYLRTLLGAGPSTLPTVQALLGMTSGEMRTFAANEATIDSLSSSVASAGAHQLDDPAVNAANKQVRTDTDNLNKIQKGLNSDITHLGDRLEDLFGKGFKAHLDLKSGTLTLALATDQNRSRNRKVTHR